MGSFARLDPPTAGIRRDVGPLLLACHFITGLTWSRRSIGRCPSAGARS